MALSKLSVLSQLKTLTTKSRLLHPPSPKIFSLRLLSFATPEDAAEERRRRKRRLRLEPPISAARPSQQQQRPHPSQNPNTPKLPESVTALTGNRLTLHNRILTLIRENDLDEAALYTRHSVYSNCRPTIFTCNAVMNALFRQSRYSDLLSLHRFITQAGIVGNVVTLNLLISVYCECRKVDTALEYYKQLINEAPFNPSPTTYRILVKGLVVNGKVEKAIEIKDEMLSKGFLADPFVYAYLMNGYANKDDADMVLSLYDELKQKLNGEVSDGIVYGGLMRGYFLKGDVDEAMRLYGEVMGEDCRVKMDALAYNFVMDALFKNGKFDEGLNLFELMKAKHSPPRTITVNLGSYNVVADGYCTEGRFKEAVDVFMNMDEKSCSPDALSFNNLIEKLCGNGLLAEAEELCGRMGEKGVSPDEVTYGLLMDTCFKEDRPDDAAGYFKKMIDEGLRPNLTVYNRLVDGLVKVGKVDNAKSYFDLMVGKLKMDAASYEFMFKALCDEGKLDEVMKMVDDMIDDGSVDLNSDMEEIVKTGLRNAGREEEELPRLIEKKEREKEEAKKREAEEAERAKASTRAAVASLLPNSGKLFGKKEEVVETAITAGEVNGIQSEMETVNGKKEEVMQTAAISADEVNGNQIEMEAVNEKKEEVLETAIAAGEVNGNQSEMEAVNGTVEKQAIGEEKEEVVEMAITAGEVNADQSEMEAVNATVEGQAIGESNGEENVDKNEGLEKKEP